MRAAWSILGSVYAASSDTINAAKSTFPDSQVCGMIRGTSGSLNDTVNLGQNESCIYRIKPESHDGLIRINLEEASNFECDEMELYILADNDVFGPYCKDKRKRRGAYGHDYGKDFSAGNHEIDMVYTNNGGIKFSFDFWFEFELLPGLPGQVQEGFHDNVASYGGSPNSGSPYGASPYGEASNSGSSYGNGGKPYQPITQKPTTNAPSTVKPTYPTTTQAPTTETHCEPNCEPTTVEPTTVEPTTVEPTTKKPTTVEPTTVEPTTVKPTTVEPTTVEPTTVKPTTVKPTTVEPTTVEPTTVKPTTVKPTTVKPTTLEPTTVEPTTVKPTTVKPTTVEPTTVKPTTVKPTTVKPTTVEPTTFKPTTVQPTTFQPTTVQPTTEYSTQTTGTETTPWVTTEYIPDTPYVPNTPKPTTQKPTNPYPNPSYKPPGNCPWEMSNHNGDCPGVEGKCNLKYFRVCGESFFNRVYDDICRWQDAKQLIPMFTAKLVPLGAAFEQKMGLSCNGYGSKSLQDLLGNDARALGDERDVATCTAAAGAPPCDLLDFTHVTTARKFHEKMEQLYSKFLKNHCNREWGVHFEALLIRMRHSLFCDDGSQSDHPGYVMSTIAPQPHNPQNTPKPWTPPSTPKPSTPKPNPPAKYPTYKPPGTCPWETSQGGDCPGVGGKCNLKYFRVCGESFFNRVYGDICRWQDAKQLIPMFTAKLVPLGGAFEVSTGISCNGYGSKSLQDLLGDGARALGDERDVASCNAAAGAPPCTLLDFTSVTTARGFHEKMEQLYSKFLKQQCNREWGVHFEALLIRMRHSLFCDDGSQSDHPGYVMSTIAPQPPVTAKPVTAKPYIPHNPQNTPKPYSPPSTPKPAQPKPTPSANYPKPPPSNPNDAYTYPGPAPNHGYCPWNAGNCGSAGCPADCPHSNPPMCSLKFVGRCYNNLFNKVYKDICKWQEALQLMPQINTWLVALGTKWESHTGKTCNANVKSLQDTDPALDYDLDSIQVEFSHRRRRQATHTDMERDVATCNPTAGLVPCSFMNNLNDVQNEMDFYFVLKDLIEHVGKKCNDEWRRTVGAFLSRLKGALICTGGLQADGR